MDASPCAAPEANGRTRHVPAPAKREVWRRDNGRCANVGRAGRLTERSFLEYHHVRPYAAGRTDDDGEPRASVPRTHNAYEASLLVECDEDGMEYAGT